MAIIPSVPQHNTSLSRTSVGATADLRQPLGVDFGTPHGRVTVTGARCSPSLKHVPSCWSEWL